MFRIARWVVRHKVGATAVVALGVFFMTPNAEDEQAQSSNPWSANAAPVRVAQVEETGFVDSMVDEAVGYLDEAGMNPVAKADETVGRFDDTATAFGKANGKN